MGRTYSFECTKCGYRAQVAGRPDRGLEFFTQTVSCLECKQLYDVVTRLRFPSASFSVPTFHQFSHYQRMLPPKRAPSFAVALNHLPLRGLNGFRWVSYSPACPASPSHRIHSWTQPGKCPKCGTIMDRTALAYRIWD